MDHKNPPPKFEKIPLAEVMKRLGLPAKPTRPNVLRAGQQKNRPYSVPTPDLYLEE